MKYRDVLYCPIHGLTEHDVTEGGRGSDEQTPATYVKCVRCREDEFAHRVAAKRGEAA